MLPKLLIIDDDPNITRTFANIIPPQGFEVMVSNSGIEGIELVRQWQPDVIMLDLMMPGMDGWQVCQQIRTFSQIPILILSAVVDTRDVIYALDQGADDYMVKPPPLAVLSARLKQLIEQRSSR
jgi:DNA-binding response OmpR family regulator